MIVKNIKSDLLQARKDKDFFKRGVLITLLGEVENVGKSAGNRKTTDEEANRVIKKFIKNIDINLKHVKDSTLLEKEKLLLEVYLPDQLSDEQLEKEISSIIIDFKNKEQRSPKVGEVMKKLKNQFGTIYDGKLASTMVRNLL